MSTNTSSMVNGEGGEGHGMPTWMVIMVNLLSVFFAFLQDFIPIGHKIILGLLPVLQAAALILSIVLAIKKLASKSDDKKDE